MTTSKTKVRNAMGRHHKTAADLARATGLSQGEVERALATLVGEGYTAQDRMDDGSYGYRRIRMGRRRR